MLWRTFNTRAPSLVAILGLAACASVMEPQVGDGGGEALPSDTSSPIDDEPADDDWCEDPIDPNLSFNFDGNWESTTLTLQWMEPDEGGDWDMNELFVFVSPICSNPQGISAPPPPRDHNHQVTDLDLPGLSTLQGALYRPGLHWDSNSNGLFDDDETRHGLGDVYPLFLIEPLPEDAASAGLIVGWNAIKFFPGNSNKVKVKDPLNIPIDADLLDG